MSDFGKALRAVRIGRGLTQGRLAVRANLSRTHLARIEGRPSTPQHYQRLVNALGFVYLDELLRAAEPGKPVNAPLTSESRCTSCDAPIPLSRTLRGRPRLRCTSCASDRAALGRAWRTANRAKVDQYNRERRGRAQRVPATEGAS